ncbi:fibronectin type III-like domain-contianing protein [Streptomyces sp. NPDC058301]|uniref:fibronectin type III-like domain-contianing protein n=1 Tax=Streptomyces sp. NPDC058301 TaxID=3346436 RepID=UPI0036E9F3A2
MRAEHGGLSVTFTVRNTSRRTGTTVAQVYIGRSPHLRLDQAERALAGYRRLELPPGGARRITVTLPAGAHTPDPTLVRTHSGLLEGETTGERRQFLGIPRAALDGAAPGRALTGRTGHHPVRRPHLGALRLAARPAHLSPGLVLRLRTASAGGDAVVTTVARAHRCVFWDAVDVA